MIGNNSKPIDVTNLNFSKEVLNSKIPVLVDFWAEWCVPCKATFPIIEQVAKEYSGKLKVVRVDVDSNRDIANNYMIRSIPTFLLFNDGMVKNQIVGAVKKSVFVDVIDKLLNDW